MIFKIIFVFFIILFFLSYLIVKGGNMKKTDLDILREKEEEMNIIKNWKSKNGEK